MVEFKIVVNDTKTGKSHNIVVSGHHANSLICKTMHILDLYTEVIMTAVTVFLHPKCVWLQ